MDFKISKNWNVEVSQSMKDGKTITFGGDLVLNNDVFLISIRENSFRFLLPETIERVTCDALGNPKPSDRYHYNLEFDVSGFEREWLIANNPEMIKNPWDSKLDERCFVVSDECIQGKYVKLE